MDIISTIPCQRGKVDNCDVRRRNILRKMNIDDDWRVMEFEGGGRRGFESGEKRKQKYQREVLL
ncbi:hypothetical protein RYX36_009928, partial [Vicia faba]